MVAMKESCIRVDPGWHGGAHTRSLCRSAVKLRVVLRRIKLLYYVVCLRGQHVNTCVSRNKLLETVDSCRMCKRLDGSFAIVVSTCRKCLWRNDVFILSDICGSFAGRNKGGHKYKVKKQKNEIDLTTLSTCILGAKGI